MCRYFSCIVTRELKILSLKKTSSHEDIIAENKLEDVRLEDRDFVRIEIYPRADDKVTRNPEDWFFKVDEEETLPEWFTKEQAKIEPLCWAQWKESVAAQLVLDGENRNVTDTEVFVYGGSSKVVAWGSSKVVARGSSTVEARDSSKVEAWDSSKVVARDSSTVVAWGSSTVEAWDSSTVEARDSSKVEAWDSSTVEARDSSKVEARDSSKVVARGSSTVEAWDSSTVEIKSATVAVLCHGKILCLTEATVIRTTTVNAAEI